MGKPPASAGAARALARPAHDSVTSFHPVRRIYNTLASRFARRPLFLPRTLRRTADAPRRAAERPPCTVVYASSEPGVEFVKALPDLQCLWCKRRFFKFADAVELMLHLRMCHSRFSFSLGEVKRERPDGERTNSEIIVYMRLQRGLAGLLNSSEERLEAYDMENTYVNHRRYGPSAVAVGEKRPLSDDEGPPGKRRRPVRTCAKRTPSEDTSGGETGRQSSANGRAGPSRKRQSEGKARSKAKVVRPKAKLAYPSVAAAVREKRLYHSVIQQPLTLKTYEEGLDSDDDNRSGLEWRLKLADDEVLDYVDTIPIEKLFMNLWNQFLRMEFVAFADRRVAPACLEFAKKYRRTIHRLNFEVTFLRHLTEMSRIGLLDADTIYSALMILRDRDPNPKSKEEESARFLFEERITKEAEEAQRVKAVVGREG